MHLEIHYLRYNYVDILIRFQFLNFFLNDKHLRTWMKDEWCKLYDGAFVQTAILSPLLR